MDHVLNIFMGDGILFLIVLNMIIICTIINMTNLNLVDASNAYSKMKEVNTAIMCI